MRYSSFILISMFLSVTGLCAVHAHAASVGFESLLQEMTDMERLTTMPDPAYVTRQFSSYDRRSTDPEILTDENWFANHDRNQHLRVEEINGREEYVLMDTEGPGAIVRFWSANPDEGGVVRFYLDHQETPEIEMSLQGFLSGGAEPFVAPFAGQRSKGWSCYMPIPYASHCKITISEGDIYYLINYRTYEAGTEVTTFSLADAKEAMPTVQAVAETLADPPSAIDRDMGRVTEYEAQIAGGAEESIEVAGSGAIYRVTCAVEAENMELALRQCVVSVAFDGHPAMVVAPLGDFFGTAPGLNSYASIPSGVQDGTVLYSHWRMPFMEQAVITVRNHGDAEVRIQGEIGFVEKEWSEAPLYFHAKWRSELDIPTRPMQDWNYMTLEGRGRYAGVMLHVANPVVAWWGEGDEKIYVDGEEFPSHFGTGTEDYFGYAWCDTALFTHAYHNQPRCDGPGNFGHTCVSRFHIMDDIPFTKSFRFDMEVWHWAETTVTQAITAYWYASADTSDNFDAIAPELLVVQELEGPQGVKGALEGEDMRVISVTSGTATPQDSGAWTWSRAQQLWWRNGKLGSALVLGFEVEEAGVYEVFAVFTKAPDYGVHQLMISGQSVQGARDFYHTEVVATEEESLGEFTLIAGENTFEAHVVGSNSDAIPDYMFGLDYLRLERVGDLPVEEDTPDDTAEAAVEDVAEDAAEDAPEQEEQEDLEQLEEQDGDDTPAE